MTLKGKHRRMRKTRKSSLRHKTRRSKAHRSKTRRSKTHSKRKTYMKGGNYETDVTTRTFEGIPTKPLNKFVVAMPGRGTMSAAAYSQLMEDLDRNGNRAYD
jgi:hypothetical protein